MTTQSYRDCVLEEAAQAVEHLAKDAAHSAMSMRNKPCRDRRDEEDYENIARTFDGRKDALKSAADAIRALKE